MQEKRVLLSHKENSPAIVYEEFELADAKLHTEIRLDGTFRDMCPKCESYTNCDCDRDYDSPRYTPEDKRAARDQEKRYNCAVAGVEYLILALAEVGVDLDDDKIRWAIKYAVDELSDNAFADLSPIGETDPGWRII